MKQKFLPSFGLISFCLLAIILGSGCGRTYDSQPNVNSGTADVKPTPQNEPTQATNTDPNIVPVGTNAGPDEAMILSVRKDVSLKRQGSSSFVPILRNVSFRIGDLLQVGNDSAAQVLCSTRGICELSVGIYSTCCTASCQVQIQMLRFENDASIAVVNRIDLPANEAGRLNQAEASIRQLELGPVTTEFLITKLHSGWKLEETNQELDRLTIRLAKPEAKEELKDLYLPVVRKTGDMQLKINKLDKAKELYQLNINSQTSDSTEKAAAHEGLAEAYKQSGDKNEAVRNFEMARDIYVKQGDAKAAAATEKRIVNTRALQRMDKMTVPRSRATSEKP